jgi:hypothetical protein
MGKIIKATTICPAWCVYKSHEGHDLRIPENPVEGSLICNKTSLYLYKNCQEGDWFETSFTRPNCVFGYINE